MMSYLLLVSAFLLIYATVVMALLLDVHPSQLSSVKRGIFLSGIPLVTLLSVVLMDQFGAALFGRYYPLFAQLPIFLIFCMVSRRGIAKVFFALLTAIFLSFPYTFFNLLIGRMTQNFLLRAVASTGVMVLLLFCIKRRMKIDFDYVMEYFTAQEILRFSAIPIFNNVLNYSVNHYAATFSQLPLRVLIFLSGLAAYSLTMNVFRRTKEMQQLQNEQLLMENGMAAANEQLVTLFQAQEQATVYRHDMRHHFALLSGYLAEGELADAMKYIYSAQSDLDAITPARYCLNNTANLIFSSFVANAKKVGVALQIEADLPQDFSLPQIELCAILSNGLENAVAAAAKTAGKEKIVHVRCSICKGTLLVSIENNYAGEVLMENGLPRSKREGHGFGAKSMAMIAKKHDGYCSFSAKDGLFVLNIALPLDEAQRKQAVR